MTPMTTADLAIYLLASPVADPFSPEVTAIAQAGYAAYTRTDQARPWDNLGSHEQIRWQLAAELVWAGDEVTGKTIRERYHLHTNQPDWEALRLPYRQQWVAVSGAMQRQRDRLRAEERMVVSG